MCTWQWIIQAEVAMVTCIWAITGDWIMGQIQSLRV